MKIPKRSTKISTEISTTTQIDSEGNETSTTIEKTKKVEISTEPDYIKLYTNMWCEFNEIPGVHRPLFLELVCRMSYCDKGDLPHSQIVATGGPFADSICRSLGWTSHESLKKGLRALLKCNAIKRVGRGFYQINPSYAGRGEWKYNPRLDRGGIEDLVATFRFKDGEVKTEITWADDGEDSDINIIMREGIGCRAKEKTVMTEKTISAQAVND